MSRRPGRLAIFKYTLHNARRSLSKQIDNPCCKVIWFPLWTLHFDCVDLLVLRGVGSLESRNKNKNQAYRINKRKSHLMAVWMLMYTVTSGISQCIIPFSDLFFGWLEDDIILSNFLPPCKSLLLRRRCGSWKPRDNSVITLATNQLRLLHLTGLRDCSASFGLLPPIAARLSTHRHIL